MCPGSSELSRKSTRRPGRGRVHSTTNLRRQVPTQSKCVIELLFGPANIPCQPVNAPGSFQVGQARTRGGQGALVRVYPTFRTIEMPLVTLWEDGRESEIPNIVSRIQQLAPGRRVPEKTPSIPVSDALRNWDEVVAILDRLLELRQS
jgi:hypothetical protein